MKYKGKNSQKWRLTKDKHRKNTYRDSLKERLDERGELIFNQKEMKKEIFKMQI